MVERCIAALGVRRLMRFEAVSKNQGRAAFEFGDPQSRPEAFFYSTCHAHYHFLSFATYSLLNVIDFFSVVVVR